MKPLDLKALELAGMILCAIVDLAIIAAAVFLYLYTGHGAWMTLLLIVVWSYGLFLPRDYQKAQKKLNEYKEKEEEQKKKAKEPTTITVKLVVDADEVFRSLGIERKDVNRFEIDNPFYQQFDNGGTTPI